ncbi:MAG: hypothetical protein AB1446_07520 [Bacillota bacterium]
MAGAVLLVYLAVVVPTNRLFFLGASTLALHILALEAGPAMGAVSVLAAALLVFLLLPVGPWTLAFWGFFAPYALVKYGADRLRWPGVAWVLKLLFFNLCLAGALTVLTTLSLGQEGRPSELLARGSAWRALVAAAGNAVFLVFDWALSYFARYFMRRFRPGYRT